MPNGKNIMIDCGSSRHAGSSRQRVAARLDALLGDNGAIDVLVLTHPDRDHYNWVNDVVGNHTINRAVHSRALSDYDEGGFDQWLGQHVGDIRDLPTPYHETRPSNLFDCGAATVQILAANVEPASPHPTDAGWQSNSASIVLRVQLQIGRTSLTAILTGDATFATEEAIQASHDADVLDADVLRLGHHGTSVTSNEQSWLDVVTPSVAFSSSGQFGGALRHPRCSVTARVLGLPSLGTSECHDLVCGVGPGPAGAACTDNWCAFSTRSAIYDTYSSGDITFTFDGTLQTTTARGDATVCGN